MEFMVIVDILPLSEHPTITVNGVKSVHVWVWVVFRFRDFDMSLLGPVSPLFLLS